MRFIVLFCLIGYTFTQKVGISPELKNLINQNKSDKVIQTFYHNPARDFVLRCLSGGKPRRTFLFPSSLERIIVPEQSYTHNTSYEVKFSNIQIFDNRSPEEPERRPPLHVTIRYSTHEQWNDLPMTSNSIEVSSQISVEFKNSETAIGKLVVSFLEPKLTETIPMTENFNEEANIKLLYTDTNIKIHIDSKYRPAVLSTIDRFITQLDKSMEIKRISALPRSCTNVMLPSFFKTKNNSLNHANPTYIIRNFGIPTASLSVPLPIGPIIIDGLNNITNYNFKVSRCYSFLRDTMEINSTIRTGQLNGILFWDYKPEMDLDDAIRFNFTLDYIEVKLQLSKKCLRSGFRINHFEMDIPNIFFRNLYREGQLKKRKRSSTGNATGNSKPEAANLILSGYLKKVLYVSLQNSFYYEFSGVNKFSTRCPIFDIFG